MSQTTVAGSFITANTIDSDHYVDGSIDLAHIGANQIDGTKLALASQAAGDIMYYNGTDWIRLAKGTADQLLTMNDGATAPGWETAASSGVSFSGSTTDGLVSYGSSSSAVVESSLTFSNGQIFILDNNDFDNACVLFKDTHSNFTGTGLTSLPDVGTIDTDTWLAIKKTDGPGGGVMLGSYAKAANTYSFVLESMVGVTNNTTTYQSVAPILFKASRHNGSNALALWSLDTYGRSHNSQISNLFVIRRPAQTGPNESFPGVAAESGDQTVFAVDARGGIFTTGTMHFHDTEGPDGGDNIPNANNVVTQRCTNTRDVPSSSSSNIYYAEDTGTFIIVWGMSESPDANRFMDLIAFAAGQTPQVITSKTVRGSPASRSYGANGYNLTLQMGSGTYNTMVMGWGCDPQIY